MSLDQRVRSLHRWLSIAFTIAVVANFVAMAARSQSAIIGFAALVPLFLLLFSGLYLFVLPYVALRRADR